MISRNFRDMKTLLLLCSAAACALAMPAAAQTAAPRPAEPVPVADLVKRVDIPYERFTLANGLRVIVHTDRKAPIVAVSVWYDVGSKHEPKGKTGFAHLFEHLMFNGSENAPGDFFEPLKQVGATDFNGTTSFDRTNYFETVPRPALDRALFLESDRMGHLTGAITQSVLDEQRGVVQNEKRGNDNQPYGLVYYTVLDELLAGNPYGHTPIGSMADLDQASLNDVKTWFQSHYGPNNAVLVLAGDIDAKQARPLVEKYFGGIPAGPKGVLPTVAIPTLSAPKTVTIKDRVAATLILRTWTVPGLNDPDAAALDVFGDVLGGLASSRLDNALVRKDKLAVQVSAGVQSMAQLGIFTVQVVVRPGVDAAAANKRLDEILADLLKNGPTADEVRRVATTTAADRISGLEAVGGFGGKAVALASGELYSGDPAHYKKELARLAGVTPEQVRAAANKWLSRPALTVMVEPGAREAYADAQAVPAKPAATAADVPVKGNRGALPAVGQIGDLAFPAVERTHLSNGIELVYANRAAVPVTRAVISFDAGVTADPDGKLGTQSMMISLLDEGTTTKDSIAIAETEERLGADIGGGSTSDRTNLSLRTPSPNLGGSLDLFADIVRNPAFAPAEVERIRRHRPGTDQPRGAGAAGDARPALRPWPSLCEARRGIGRSRRGQGARPRRSRRLPPCLDPARQGQDLRGQRSSPRRGSRRARDALRQLETRRTGRREGLRRRPGPVGAQDRAGRPARFSPVADPRGSDDEPQGDRRAAAGDRRERDPRFGFPVADQHGSAGGQALVLWRGRRLQPA